MAGLAFDLFQPRASYHQPVRSVLVLAPGCLPSTDIYLRPRLEVRSGLAVRYIDTLTAAPDSLELAPGTFVVVVRHAPVAWLRRLSAGQENLSGVAYFMDDDIPGILASPDLPKLYAWKTAARYLSTRERLGTLCDAVWVSTSWLRTRYPAVPTRVLPPLYVGDLAERPGEGASYFYPGTASHRLEMRWLLGVVRGVQERLPSARFEIHCRGALARRLAAIPGVTVRAPESWPEFLANSAQRRHAVGLAPMLDSPFNRARSHNKFYDITRCGAAGIYSDFGAFRGQVIDGVTGRCLRNDRTLWVEEICRLLVDRDERARLYRNALAQCRQQVDDPAFQLGP